MLIYSFNKKIFPSHTPAVHKKVFDLPAANTHIKINLKKKIKYKRRAKNNIKHVGRLMCVCAHVYIACMLVICMLMH